MPDRDVDDLLDELDAALAEARVLADELDATGTLHPLDSPSPFVRQAQTMVGLAKVDRAQRGAVDVCGFPSSVSDATCILPAGHPADSHSRYHRFARPGA
jgi:hypothetical protein